MRELDGIGPGELEGTPDGADNTVATILYHLELIEADWLVNGILQVGGATDTFRPGANRKLRA